MKPQIWAAARIGRRQNASLHCTEANELAAGWMLSGFGLALKNCWG